MNKQKKLQNPIYIRNKPVISFPENEPDFHNILWAE